MTIQSVACYKSNNGAALDISAGVAKVCGLVTLREGQGDR